MHNDNVNTLQITFSIPEFYGTNVKIGADNFHIFPMEGERLTDSFLNSLLQITDAEEMTINLYNSEERDNLIQFSFTGNLLTVADGNKDKETYPVSYQQFKEAFLAHIYDYALYYAAPYNYQAFFLLPFEKMKEKFSKYEQAAEKIRNRLRK